MAYSRNTRIGNGSTSQFTLNLTLGYMSQNDISCRVGTEVDGLGAPSYRTITFISDNLVQIGGAIPTIGTEVVFDRNTTKTSLVVDFADGDNLTGDNLDAAVRQVMLLVHEVLDGKLPTIEALAATLTLAAQIAATNSANSATSSQASSLASAASANASLTSRNSFFEVYLGAADTAPIVKPNGGALTNGCLYYNTTVSRMHVFESGVWNAAYSSTTTDASLLTSGTIADAILPARLLGVAQDARYLQPGAVGVSFTDTLYVNADSVGNRARIVLRTAGGLNKAVLDHDTGNNVTEIGNFQTTGRLIHNSDGSWSTINALAASSFTASSTFNTTQNFIILGPKQTGSGGVYLRPNGVASTTGELALSITAATINGSAIHTDGNSYRFGAPNALIEDQKASGTNAQPLTANVWNIRDLNTKVYDPYGLMVVASNLFAPVIDGWVEWNALGSDYFQTRLFCVTDNVVVSQGSSLYIGSQYMAPSTGGGAVVAGKYYRIEQNTNTPRVGGFAATRGGAEVYTRVLFWRK